VSPAEALFNILAEKYEIGGFGVAALDTSEEEEAAPITRYDDPEPMVYQKAPGFKSSEDQPQDEDEACDTKPKIVCTIDQNKLIADAVLHAVEACPSATDCRLLPSKREFTNLLR
jgi:hypothetical protein